ncbi:MAG: ADP-dependent NAD(P)H-hydrate dehydratase [Agrococcus casei]|uniref:ADP-dependent NAD(P)H-hydrate dehydratase n=1 Tax=Agrococcus casei TaxID=343512 RepID=UPI003F90B17E
MSSTSRWLAGPDAGDDKYSRGVLAAVTGSLQYPGAATLAVEGAWRTGVGLVRLGAPLRVQDLVLGRRPETIVSTPEDLGRADAYLLGSGLDDPAEDEMLRDALVGIADSGAPVVLDAGALGFAMRVRGLCLVTPHAGELARMLGWLGRESERADVVASPAEHAAFAAENTGAVVVLKGATTHIATPSGAVTSVAAETNRLATAGSGDVLAGILGGLVAQHAPDLATREQLAELAAAGVSLHSRAAARLGDRPLAALEIAESVAYATAELNGP